MTVYYAIGGGLGHARRAQRVLEALAIRNAEIITTDDVPRALERDREAHRAWLVERFHDHHVIIDTFPAGIHGELAGIEDITFDYVARLLKWNEYRHAVPFEAPRFRTTYVVEELTKEHEAFAQANSDQVETLSLSLRATGNGQRATNYSLIVHSGPATEVHELVEYTRELQPNEHVLVATRCDIQLPSGFEKLDTHRAEDFFPNATRIISAAGFNVMLETEPFRDKHHVVPFPRRFDDQFLRAARRRR